VKLADPVAGAVHVIADEAAVSVCPESVPPDAIHANVMAL
jgi:hypothetical protein